MFNKYYCIIVIFKVNFKNKFVLNTKIFIHKIIFYNTFFVPKLKVSTWIGIWNVQRSLTYVHCIHVYIS